MTSTVHKIGYVVGLGSAYVDPSLVIGLEHWLITFGINIILYPEYWI